MKIRVKGTYALLTHNPAAMLLNGSGNGEVKRNVKNIPTPEVEADAGAYHLEDGGYGIPGFAFRNSILSAAVNFKSDIKKRASLQNDMASIMVLEEMVPLIDDAGKRINSYEIDTRRVVIQGNGIMRSRPKFRDWGAEFTVEYDENVLNENQIIAVTGYAGQYKGLPGPFGRYAVVTDSQKPVEKTNGNGKRNRPRL